MLIQLVPVSLHIDCFIRSHSVSLSYDESLLVFHTSAAALINHRTHINVKPHVNYKHKRDVNISKIKFVTIRNKMTVIKKIN